LATQTLVGARNVCNLLSLLWIERDFSICRRPAPGAGSNGLRLSCLSLVHKGFSKSCEAWEWSFSPAMILGSSMVRNVTVPGAKTTSYPGAGVNYIPKLLLNVLHQDMDIDSIVVYVGFNNIVNDSSEQLKLDFKELIDSARH
jgi:hypothetical protein